MQCALELIKTESMRQARKCLEEPALDWAALQVGGKDGKMKGMKGKDKGKGKGNGR